MLLLVGIQACFFKLIKLKLKIIQISFGLFAFGYKLIKFAYRFSISPEFVLIIMQQIIMFGNGINYQQLKFRVIYFKRSMLRVYIYQFFAKLFQRSEVNRGIIYKCP